MADLLTLDNAWHLLVIFILEMILGFDNLLYISIEANRGPIGQQERLRKQGIIWAVILRIILLWLTIIMLARFQKPFFSINGSGGDHFNLNLPVDWIQGDFNLQVLVFIVGGAFLMYTAIKEISHMLSVDDLHSDHENKHSSAMRVMINILIMNLVFSFDSTLTAMAISKVFEVMAAGIILSGLAMFLIADGFARFLEKNRMYEVLGLFVLLIVGVSLLGEGGHLGHLKLFGHPIEPLAKTTFYFSIAVLFMVEVVQSRYQRKLDKIRAGKTTSSH